MLGKHPPHDGLRSRAEVLQFPLSWEKPEISIAQQAPEGPDASSNADVVCARARSSQRTPLGSDSDVASITSVVAVRLVAQVRSKM